MTYAEAKAKVAAAREGHDVAFLFFLGALDAARLSEISPEQFAVYSRMEKNAEAKFNAAYEEFTRIADERLTGL